MIKLLYTQSQCTRSQSDQHKHGPVGDVSDGEHMGRHLVPLLALVDLDDLLGVDGKPLVGIHHHTEQSRVGLRGYNESEAVQLLVF